MTDIPDIISHEPMREPTPPLCKHCGVELDFQQDRKTGKPVRHRGRAMLRCPVCGEVVIGTDYRSARRRFRVVSGLCGLSASLSLGAWEVIQFAMHYHNDDASPDSLMLALRVIVAAGAGMMVSAALEACALAISPGSPVARLYAILSGLLSFAMAALCVWTLVGILPTK
jgi:predicted RNA-binding Zn-ribbon protein involved in translation (DUF1610 family)